VTLEIITEGAASVAAVDGRLDLRSAPDLRLQLTAALAAGGGSIVLDLSEVEFIDSSGLGVLVGVHREAERRGGRLAMVPPHGSASQIFTLTRTEGFFHLVPTREAGRDRIVV